MESIFNVLCAVSLALIADAIASAGLGWTYTGSEGPDHWHLDYPHCGGVKQSPINIVTSDVIVDSKRLTPIEFRNYDKAKENAQYTLINNGHTVQVDVTDHFIKINGSGLPGTFVAKQFHFHWGKEDSRGSEHSVNGQYFPMEMHIVHYNKKYGSYENALNRTSDGLAVLGFLFEVGPYNSPFQTIIDKFGDIEYKYQNISIDAFPLTQLIPENLTKFYRYEGGLTTPPCYESVQWTLYHDTIKIAEEQLDKFRSKIYENEGSTGGSVIDISDDFRPVQCLFRRKVYASVDSMKTVKSVAMSTSGTAKRSSNTILATMLLLVLCVHRRYSERNSST